MVVEANQIQFANVKFKTETNFRRLWYERIVSQAYCKSKLSKNPRLAFYPHVTLALNWPQPSITFLLVFHFSRLVPSGPFTTWWNRKTGFSKKRTFFWLLFQFSRSVPWGLLLPAPETGFRDFLFLEYFGKDFSFFVLVPMGFFRRTRQNFHQHFHVFFPCLKFLYLIDMPHTNMPQALSKN